MAKKKILFRSFNKWHLLWIIPSGLIGLFIVAMILLPDPQYTDGFRTLSEIKEYADGLDEWVEMENDKVFYPTYNRYYQKKFKSSLLTKTTQKLKCLLNKHSTITPSTLALTPFKELLCNITEFRTKKGFTGDFIQKIDGSRFSTVVVLGSLYGAFHSLARDLNKLMELNIVDNNLKLTDKNTAIIFLGNAFTKSPFCLETFLTVLGLMQKNPDQVIYIKGHQEMDNEWKLQSLHKELSLAFPGKENRSTNLEKDVDHFFNTLPLAAYYTFLENNETCYFKFAYAAIKENILNLNDKNLSEKADAFLMEKQASNIDPFKLEANSSSYRELIPTSPPHLKTIISSILKRNDIPDTDGLTLLAPFHGTIRWRIVSSPTLRTKKVFDCFNDAFAIISLPKSHEWKITLYHRDVRNLEQKFSKKTYNLLTGQLI